MSDQQPPVERLVPDLEPHRINIEQYYAYAPEKFELIDGYLFAPPPWDEWRRNLLLLLLYQEGLREAVRLAPPEAWRAALREVYGDES